MAKYFICGHGSWSPNDGFTFVPKGTSVTFYTMGNKAMRSSDVIRIVTGTYTGAPDLVAGPYRSVQNMTLSPDDPDLRTETEEAAPPGARLYFTNAERKLDYILNELRGHDLVWACCRSYDLADSGCGSKYGSGIADTQSAGGFGDIINGVWTPMYTLSGNKIK